MLSINKAIQKIKRIPLPDLVEAIVNGAEPDGLSIAQILKNIPEDWNEQRKSFGFPER